MLRRILIATLMATSLSALCWEANVDYIYWKAAGSDLPWITVDVEESLGGLHSFARVLRSDYCSGVKVEAAVEFSNCWSLVGRYAWLQPVDRVKFGKPSDSTIQLLGAFGEGPASSVTGAIAVQTKTMHMADLAAALPISSGCWGSLDFLGGITFLYARRTYAARYVGGVQSGLNVVPVQYRNHFSGAGPLLGIRSIYHAFSCLDAIAELSLLTVIGPIHSSSLAGRNVPSSRDSSVERVTSSSAGGVMSLGSRYHRNWCGYSLSASFGWEERLYLQVTSSGSRENSGGLDDSFDEGVIRNLFVGGPYIGLGVQF